MKTYSYGREIRPNTDADKKVPLPESVAVPADNAFAKAAYEWNNALLLAARKMWDTTPSLHR